jgi:hypothetical protein
MELIERYLQSVRFWLPKTKQQEGILAELGDDLRSQIEEREAELKRPLDKHEVAEILKRCGPPMVVAARLAPKRYLIGPTLFPIYVFVLKMVLLWIMVPVFVFIVGPATLGTYHGDWGRAIATTFGSLWSGSFIAAGVITLVFAILDRTHTIAQVECKWDPLKLPPVRKHDRKPSLLQTVCDLAFNFIGLIWILLVPHNPFLIFGPAASFLKPGPIWHGFYIPIVAVCVFGLVRPAITLRKPHWTWWPSLGQALQNVFVLIILKFMLDAIGPTPSGAWQPFVVLQQGAVTAQSIRVSAIVNVSVLVGLLGTWVGLCIAIPIQIWHLMRKIRKENSSREHAAPVQVQ